MGKSPCKIQSLLGGNDYSWDAVNAFSGASHGWVLKGDGKGNFEQLPFDQSGFFVKGAIRALHMLNGDNKKKYYLVAVNGKPLRIFEQSKCSNAGATNRDRNLEDSLSTTLNAKHSLHLLYEYGY